MDASTIELCLSLLPWAKYIEKSGAAKIHVAIDGANDLPEFCIVTNGGGHDLAVARAVKFKPRTTVVVRNYCALEWLSEINSQGSWGIYRS